MMLSVYGSSPTGTLRRLEQFDPMQPGQLAWIDLLHPTAEEGRQIETALGIALPTREEMAEIEDSSRFYQDNGALFLTAAIMSLSESEFPATTDVTFVLVGNLLLTVRYGTPRPFQAFAGQAERQPGLVTNGESALLGLLDACLDRVADHIERTNNEVDTLVHEVLAPEDRPLRRRRGFKYAEMLRQLERNQAVVSKARTSLLSLNRLMSYVARPTQGLPSGKTFRSQVLTLIHDVRSLIDHTNFLGNSITFELQAILGMVGIEQNNIIKIFSVAAVVLLPPTLVASIYGMNFEVMPELRWLLGYPFALLIMVLSSVIPYWVFKRRGWL
jgi:magnesium transporter